VLLSSPEVLISAGDTIFAARPVEGRFPDYASVLPKAPAPVAFKVSPLLLIDLLKAAAAVARTADGGPGVEVLYWSSTSPIGVTARGADGVTFDGLLMPLA
jgi:hypothetical protein